MRNDLQHRLGEWQRAGLISAEQVTAIAAFEQAAAHHNARPYAFYALGGLGALAVAIGLISLVAANWDAIPPAMKLVLDLLIGAGLALGAVRAESAGSRFVREVLVLIFFGYVLASIGLIGQIYQLGGQTHEALLLLCIITFAAMLHLRTGLGAAVWLVVLEATWLMNGYQIIDKLYHRSDEAVLFAALWFVTALLLVLIGGAAPVRARRPALANVAWQLGAVQTLGMLALGPQLFYARISEIPATAPIALIVTLAVTITVITRVPALFAAIVGRVPDGNTVLALIVLLGGGTTLGLLATLVPHPSLNLLGALSFLALFTVVGWVGYAARSYPLFQIATAILAVRVLIIYFEVIGSLLGSGLGLICGGVLTLTIAWYWRKKTVQMHGAFAAELPPEETGDVAHAAGAGLAPPLASGAASGPASGPAGSEGGAQ